MTVSELMAELRHYVQMGMGDETVHMAVQGRYSTVHRTEPGDGIQEVFLLDKDTP